MYICSASFSGLPQPCLESLIPPSLYAAEYATKERNMLFIHTIGYISVRRPRGDDRTAYRTLCAAVSLARAQMGLELQDKVSGPSALSHALTS